MSFTTTKLTFLAVVICLLCCLVIGEDALFNPKEVTDSSISGDVLPQGGGVEEEEKQGYGTSTERGCVVSGRACELLVQHRLCCSGNPCQIVPSQILQLFTLGGWGICH